MRGRRVAEGGLPPCDSDDECEALSPCEVASCVDNFCESVLPADTCAISVVLDGLGSEICYKAGVEHPKNACWVCDPDTNPYGWSDQVNNTPCDDGDLCTDQDECGDGIFASPERTSLATMTIPVPSIIATHPSAVRSRRCRELPAMMGTRAPCSISATIRIMDAREPGMPAMTEIPVQ